MFMVVRFKTVQALRVLLLAVTLGITVACALAQAGAPAPVDAALGGSSPEEMRLRFGFATAGLALVGTLLCVDPREEQVLSGLALLALLSWGFLP